MTRERRESEGPIAQRPGSGIQLVLKRTFFKPDGQKYDGSLLLLLLSSWSVILLLSKRLMVTGLSSVYVAKRVSVDDILHSRTVSAFFLLYVLFIAWAPSIGAAQAVFSRLILSVDVDPQ